MDDRVPRYEFRLVAPDLSTVASELCRQAKPDNYRESLEIYLLIRGNGDLNLKIRDDALELKALLRRHRGLEQWSPVFRIAFPATAMELATRLKGVIGANSPLFTEGSWDVMGFVRRITEPDVGVTAVSLYKRRRKFQLDQGTAEIVELLVNGARQMSVALEADDPEQVLNWRRRLGLERQCNVNYLLAIERVLGRAPLPPDAFYNAGYQTVETPQMNHEDPPCPN